MQQFIINCRGKIYVFKNTRGEKKNMFIARCWYIVENIDNFKNDYEKLENQSHLWVNEKFLGVQYDNMLQVP